MQVSTTQFKGLANGFIDTLNMSEERIQVRFEWKHDREVWIEVGNGRIKELFLVWLPLDGFPRWDLASQKFH